MEPFIGQIQLFGFNFPPRGWTFCNGQLLAISQNEALFALLGTTYGGDGRTTFGLPDFRGRVGIHNGTGIGLDPIQWGERGGRNYVELSEAYLPTHDHQTTNNISVKIQTSEISNPVNSGGDGTATFGTGGDESIYTEDPNFAAYLPESTVQMAGNVTLGANGASQPINLMQPYLGIYHSIALVGIFPSRN